MIVSYDYYLALPVAGNSNLVLLVYVFGYFACYNFGIFQVHFRFYTLEILAQAQTL